MPYRVIKDGATVQQAHGKVVGRDGTEYDEVSSVVYPEGAILDDNQVAPRTREMLDDGDEHIASLIEKISDSDASSARDQQLKDREEAFGGPPSAIQKDTSAGGDQAPYIDYSALSADALVERIKSLTPAQGARVVAWERDHGLNRPEVVEFDVSSLEDWQAEEDGQAKGAPDPQDIAGQVTADEEEQKGPEGSGRRRKKADAPEPASTPEKKG